MAEKFEVGELVVLTSGSMRMAVEGQDGDRVAVVWCHEGQVGRDAFDPRLLKKWEHREDDRATGAERVARPGGGRPYKGGREGGGRPFGGGDERPPRQTGWDGKPREKPYFRKG